MAKWQRGRREGMTAGSNLHQSVHLLSSPLNMPWVKFHFTMEEDDSTSSGRRTNGPNIWNAFSKSSNSTNDTNNTEQNTSASSFFFRSLTKTNKLEFSVLKKKRYLIRVVGAFEGFQSYLILFHYLLLCAKSSNLIQSCFCTNSVGALGFRHFKHYWGASVTVQ